MTSSKKRCVLLLTSLLAVAPGCEGSYGPWAFADTGYEASVTLESTNQAVAMAGDFATFAGNATEAADSRVVDVFQRGASGLWDFQARLQRQPGNPELDFGEALAMEANHLVIGGSREYGTMGQILPPGARLGYIDYYLRGRTGYQFVKTLSPTIPAGTQPNYTYFAHTLDVEAPWVVVGASRYGSNIGRAFVFDLNSSAQTDLTEADPTFISEQYYGTVVRIDSGRIAVSKPRFCEGSGVDRPCYGQVFIYELVGGAWTRTHSVQSPEVDASEGSIYIDAFGDALAIEGNHLVVADARPDSDGARLYVYEFGARTGWVHQQTLETAGVSRHGLAMDGIHLAVGEPTGGTDADTSVNVSQVRMFHLEGSTFVEDGAIVLPSTSYASGLGLSGQNMIVSTSSPRFRALFFRQGP